MTKTVKILHQPARPRFEAHSKVPSRAVFRIDRQTARQRRRAFKSPNRIAKALFTTPPLLSSSSKKRSPSSRNLSSPRSGVSYYCYLRIDNNRWNRYVFFLPSPLPLSFTKKEATQKSDLSLSFRYRFPPSLSLPLYHLLRFHLLERILPLCDLTRIRPNWTMFKQAARSVIAT